MKLENFKKRVSMHTIYRFIMKKEGDTVHGTDGYFVTLAERKSKLFLSARVKRKRNPQYRELLSSY